MTHLASRKGHYILINRVSSKMNHKNDVNHVPWIMEVQSVKRYHHPTSYHLKDGTTFQKNFSSHEPSQHVILSVPRWYDNSSDRRRFIKSRVTLPHRTTTVFRLTAAKQTRPHKNPSESHVLEKNRMTAGQTASENTIASACHLQLKPKWIIQNYKKE